MNALRAIFYMRLRRLSFGVLRHRRKNANVEFLLAQKFPHKAPDDGIMIL